MPDEHSQPDAEEAPGLEQSPRKRTKARGIKGNVAAQRQRYRSRHPASHRSYMRRYMAERRRIAKQAATPPPNI